MSTVAKRRKPEESLEGSTKRLRIDNEHTDDDLSSEASDSSVDEDDLLNSSKGTSTPLTTPSSASTPKLPPCRLKTLKCSYPPCPKSFNRPARLASHLRSHTNTRPFICTYADCSKSYIEEKHLRQHIKGTHTHERSHHCDWEGCAKSFLTATRLRRHIAAHEGHERFRCTAYSSCNQTFRKHQTLQRHIRAEHMQLSPFPCTWVDPRTEEVCGAGFDGSVGLKKHQEKVHGVLRFTCSECPSDRTPVSFSTAAQLQKHIKKEHATCIFCDEKFSSQRELQKHVESQHSGTSLQDRKTIRCTYNGCSKTFVKKSNLSVHIRTAHNGERFICGSFDVSDRPDLSTWNAEGSCGKDFYSKASLEDHVRTAHLGLRSMVNSMRKPTEKQERSKYKIDIFDDLLGESQAPDPRRTIPCNILGCQTRFIRAYDLEVHVRTKHNEHSKEDEQLLDQMGNLLDGLAENESSMGALYDEADIDWEMQRRAMEGGAFWIGADEQREWQSGDHWNEEEREMRELVAVEGCIDPCLMGQ